MREAIIGLDLGTSSIKGLLVDEKGEILFSHRFFYPILRTHPHWAEQDPFNWIRGLQRVLSYLLFFARKEKIVPLGLCLSGQIPTLVLTDRRGKPLRSAITWLDNRAEEEASHLRKKIGLKKIYQITGQILDGRYLVSMLKWIEKNESHLVSKPYLLFSAKDYLLFYLTDKRFTDPSTASGYGFYSLREKNWSKQLLSLMEIEEEILPFLRDSQEIGGYLKPELEKFLGLSSSLPVFTGSADSISGALALGAVTEEVIGHIFGSSSVILACSNILRLSTKISFLVSPSIIPQMWHPETDLLVTGSGIEWLKKILNLSPDENVESFLRLAKNSPPLSGGVICFPFLAEGEQGAIWDPNAKGAFLGLTLFNDSSDLARSFLEGVGFEIRRCLGCFQEVGISPKILLSSGLEDELFLEILTNILELPVYISSIPDVSAYGAALIALKKVKSYSWRKIIEIAKSKYEDKIFPDKNLSNLYREGYERYLHIDGKLRNNLKTKVDYLKNT